MIKQSDEMKSDGEGVGGRIHLDRLAHKGTSIEMTFERRHELREKGSRAPGGNVFGLFTKQREASVMGLGNSRGRRRWDVAVKRETGILPTPLEEAGQGVWDLASRASENLWGPSGRQTTHLL